MKETRFLELDSLRGVAALMVVLFHLFMGSQNAAVYFNLGTTGVDLFFIISGFVISMSIDNVSSGKEFVINRISRLYPTYWVSVTFTFLLLSIYGYHKNETIRWFDYLCNLTMFQYYLGAPDLDGPYWTMIIEMIFYAFILILFIFHIISYIKYIGLGLLVFILVFRITSTEYINTIFEAIPFLQFFPLFFAGVIFYKMRTTTKDLTHYAIIFLCLIIQISLFEYAGKSSAFIDKSEYSVMLMFFFSIFILFVNGRCRFLITKPLMFIGKISFALYLTHQYILLGHVLPFLINRLGINYWISAIGICLPLALLIASCITYFIEIPFGKLMKKGLNQIFKVAS